MKLVLATLALALSAPAFAHDPHPKRTSNGGTEFYTNTKVGQGDARTGCFIPEQYEGSATTTPSPNSKLVHAGDIDVFVDCKLPAPVVVRPAAQVVRTPAPVVTPAPAPKPVVVAPAPKPTVIPPTKKVRE